MNSNQPNGSNNTKDNRVRNLDGVDAGPQPPAQETKQMTTGDLKPGSIWRNKKRGVLYQVSNPVAIDCTNSRNGSVCVVYHEAGELVPQETYVRERAEFLEKFEHVSEAGDHA